MIDAILSAPAVAFTAVLEACDALTGNWWAALFLFTLATKIVLVPLSVWVQKNYIVMLQLMPDVNRIKAEHFGDRETVGEKQGALYHDKHYHPLLSMVPLLVQIVILLCLVNAVYAIAGSGAAGTELLGLVPAQSGGATLLVPVAAGLSALVLGWSQNHINPLQREQTRKEQLFVNGLSVALAVVLGVFVACGLGFYWICSNLLSIAVQALMNVVVDPRKHVDYAALRESRAELEKLEGIEEEGAGSRRKRRRLAAREKADCRRFAAVAGKHIVFYSEGGGFYKYFRGAIEWLLAHSDVVIHYVTNDPDDRIFARARQTARIRPYYVGRKRAISFMMKMDADVVVTTLVDLDNYYIKRSYVRHDVFYVFMPHHMSSMHLVIPKAAVDHYDAVLCAGPHQVRELEREEKLYGVARKELVACGYDLLDADIVRLEDARDGENGENPTAKETDDGGCPADEGDVGREGGGAAGKGGAGKRPSVLVAPSWQEDNILDSCIDELLGELCGHGWRIVVRPHPEYLKRYRPRWEAVRARHADRSADELVFEEDFSSDATVFSASLLVTDWSSIFCEYAFSTLRPCVFIDTPMKVRNPDWEELGMQPVDLLWRDELGVSFAPDALDGLGDAAAQMVGDAGTWADRIAAVRESSIFNLGRGAEVAGEYLLAKILEKQGESARGAREREQDGGEDAGKRSGGADRHEDGAASSKRSGEADGKGRRA